jgi:uncharacterized MAPEG superfamily protein
MTTDLWMLVWTVLLAAALPMILLVGRVQVPGGMAWALGNRDTPLRLAPWAERTERAHRNLIENLGGFAALVLIAHVSGHANAMTALGATIFFLGRVVHAAVYIAGIVGVRTAAFVVAVIGELLILLQLF